MKNKILALLLLSASLTARPETQTNRALEEARIALLDTERALSQQELQIQLLEEKIAKLEELEKTQKKILADLLVLKREIETQAGQISEVTNLKSTLNSISQAVARIHKVSSGDTLDKIARRYNTSVENIKEANGLRGNTILLGQELRIP